METTSRGVDACGSSESRKTDSDAQAANGDDCGAGALKNGEDKAGPIETCSKSCCKERPPVCLGSLSWRQSCKGERPTKTILCSGEGRDHFGFPGGMCSPGRFAVWWQASQRMP